MKTLTYSKTLYNQWVGLLNAPVLWTLRPTCIKFHYSITNFTKRWTKIIQVTISKANSKSIKDILITLGINMKNNIKSFPFLTFDFFKM